MKKQSHKGRMDERLGEKDSKKMKHAPSMSKMKGCKEGLKTPMGHKGK